MLYHPKMGKLLAKEGNVTKVPVHTYGERERPRKSMKSSPSAKNEAHVFECFG